MSNPNHSPPTQGNTMGFLSHLVELRDRLMRMVWAIGLVFLVLMPFAKEIYALFASPLSSALPVGQSLIAIDVASVFFVPYKLALMLAFVITLPYILHQLWSFIAPGLYKHEQRMVMPLLLSSVTLFYIGMAFAYFIVLPLIFSVLQTFTPENVAATPDIAKYLDFVLMMFIAFGVGFEMPIATVLLIITGIATRESLANQRPYVIVGAFTIGMLLTPPDVISQVLLAIPMWLLFELGLVASQVFAKQIEAMRKAREAQDQAMQDQEHNQTILATTGAGVAAGASTWEDSQYIYEETQPNTPTPSVASDYRPLTDAEMEAEFARIEAEQVKMDAEHAARQQADNSPPTDRTQ